MPLCLRERDLVPIVQEAGCAPGLVWMGAEYLMPTSIWSTDRPACSELLYRLLSQQQMSRMEENWSWEVVQQHDVTWLKSLRVIALLWLQGCTFVWYKRARPFYWLNNHGLLSEDSVSGCEFKCVYRVFVFFNRRTNNQWQSMRPSERNLLPRNEILNERWLDLWQRLVRHIRCSSQKIQYSHVMYFQNFWSTWTLSCISHNILVNDFWICVINMMYK